MPWSFRAAAEILARLATPDHDTSMHFLRASRITDEALMIQTVSIQILPQSRIAEMRPPGPMIPPLRSFLVPLRLVGRTAIRML